MHRRRNRGLTPPHNFTENVQKARAQARSTITDSHTHAPGIGIAMIKTDKL